MRFIVDLSTIFWRAQIGDLPDNSFKVWCRQFVEYMSVRCAASHTVETHFPKEDSVVAQRDEVMMEDFLLADNNRAQLEEVPR